MKMNIVVSSLIIAAVLSIGAMLPAKAQTNQPPIPDSPSSFMSQVTGWLTSFDTNSTTFTDDRFNLSSGIFNIDNAQTAVNFQMEIRLGSTPLWFENDMRNVVALGRVLSDQAGFNYSIVRFDLKASLGVDVGHRFDTDQTYASPLIRIKKAIGKFTYIQLQGELPIYFNHGSSTSGTGVTGMTWGASTGFVF